MKELNTLTIAEATAKLAAGEIKSSELLHACLAAINKYEDTLHAFITAATTDAQLMAEAEKAARASEARWQLGKPLSPLDGIPYVIKDSFCTKNIRTTAGSRMLDDFMPPYDATVVTRLRSAGAILIGKTNLDQFGHGSSTENSAFGPSKNPYDIKRVPGGSSGGSAVAVAADLCLFAIGEDTGGSIRQPASFCNITGLKVTYGRVSRYGSIAYASSLDTMGPMTKTVADAALVLQVIAGHDEADATSSFEPVPNYQAALTEKKSYTIGLPQEFYGEGVDPRITATINQAVEQLKAAGHTVKPVSIPVIKQALACYYIIAWAETSSNLARFDGIHFGHSVLKEGAATTLAEVYSKSRATGFSSETKRRLMLGTYVLSAGYYDAYYKKALQVRTALVNGFNEAFKEVDILLAPVSPVLPFEFGAKSDPIAMYMADIHTTPINPAGVPSLAIPAGFVDENGTKLPVGLQLIGPLFSEAKLLNLGQQWQSINQTHLTKPTLQP